MAASVDICIRGAGIVGRTLALLLARERLRVALVAPPPDAASGHGDVRAYALSPAARTLLQGLRCWPNERAATPVLAMEVHGDERGAVRFDATAQGVPALNWIVDVPALEKQLAEAVNYQSGIDVVAAPAAAPLTVVCEGRASRTRAELGVEFDTTRYPQHAIATRLDCERPHGQVARQWFTAEGDIVAFLPLDGADGRQVAVVWSVLAERVPALLAHAEPEGLLEPWPGERPQDTVVLRGRYRVVEGVAPAVARLVERIGVIGRADHRAGPDGVAGRGSLAVEVFRSPAQEAAAVATRLRSEHLERGVPWQSMVVVCRGRSRTEGIRRALAGHGVPVVTAAADLPLRDEPAVRPLMALFDVVVARARDPRAAVAPEVALDALTSPLGGADPVTLRRLRRGLRADELAAGGARTSDELLVAGLLGEVVTVLADHGQRLWPDGPRRRAGSRRHPCAAPPAQGRRAHARGRRCRRPVR